MTHHLLPWNSLEFTSLEEEFTLPLLLNKFLVQTYMAELNQYFHLPLFNFYHSGSGILSWRECVEAGLICIFIFPGILNEAMV